MRFTKWNPGLNSVNGIPARNTEYQIISPSGGEDPDEIQDAIDNCPSGQVVKLTAGIFIVNNYILLHIKLSSEKETVIKYIDKIN